MIEEQFETLSQFLPKDIYMGDSLEYASYHARAVTVNGNNELYTLEYFAFHILWMSYLEKVAFQLFQHDAPGVIHAFGNDGSTTRVLQNALTLYDLSVINERKLCEITKHPLIAYHGNQVSNLRELIDKRDHIAHCSGILDLSGDDIVHYANRCIRAAEDIQRKVSGVTVSKWVRFIDELNGNDDQYSLVNDVVIEFLRTNFLSIADIKTILEQRVTLDSAESDNSFRTNLAYLKLAQIAEDYGADPEVDHQSMMNEILSHHINDEQRSLVKDEIDAYIQFRVGLM